MRAIAAFCCSLILTIGLHGQSACIQGTVVDDAGSPVSNVHVIGFSSVTEYSFDVMSDEEGSFSVDGLAPGPYEIATGDGYKTDFLHIKFGINHASLVSRAIATERVNGQCPSATIHTPTQGRLHLQVTDILTGAPVTRPNAQYRFNATGNWNGGMAETADLGVPPDSNIEVQVFADGYEDSAISQVTALRSGEARAIHFALRPLQTGCLTGTVVDDHNVPVDRVTVQAELESNHVNRPTPGSITSKDGRFRIEGLQPGHYLISTNAWSLDYLPVPFVRGRTPVTIPPTAGCTDVRLSLGPKAAKLKISITDSTTRKRIADPQIWMSGEDSEDSWSLRGMGNPILAPPLKLFTFSVRAKGYKSTSITISPLTPEETKEVEVELQPEITSDHKN